MAQRQDAVNITEGQSTLTPMRSPQMPFSAHDKMFTQFKRWNKKIMMKRRIRSHNQSLGSIRRQNCVLHSPGESRGCYRFRRPRREQEVTRHPTRVITTLRSPSPQSNPVHFCTQPGLATPEMAEGTILKRVRRSPLFFRQTHTRNQAYTESPVLLEELSRFATR